MKINRAADVQNPERKLKILAATTKLSCCIYIFSSFLLLSPCSAEQTPLSDDGSTAPARTWKGRTASEKMFFTLGMMNAYAEAVKNKAKILGLGEPLSSEETDELFEYAKQIAHHNGVKIYREPDLLVTDLFPAHITRNKHVILIYLDDTLDNYMAIKADKASLLESGQYKGQARKNIARRFAKLLSYSDDVVEQKLKRNINAE